MKRSCKFSRSGRSSKSKDAILSTSSDGEGVKMNTRITRMSSGKRKTDKDSKGPGWVESVYDADEDTTSDSSSQQNSDPYEFSFKDDDVEVKAKKNKKQPKKVQSRQATKKKGSKKMKSNATSTPVLIGQVSGKVRVKHSNQEKELLVTPEVTPILPVKPDDCNMGALDDNSCNTPTVRRSLRKRSLHLEEHLSSMASIRSISSQGDSGIVVSPPLKKMKSPESFQSNSSLKKDPPVVTGKERKQTVVHKKNVSDSTAAVSNMKNQKRKVLAHKTENAVVKKCKSDKSCFSVESSSSVSVSVSEENVPKTKTNKTAKTQKHSYRSSKASTSSPDRHVKDTSECMDQENNQRFPTSPILFSDNLFSDDSAEVILKVSKTSSRSYTSLKAKTQKAQQQISKLDSWANEMNSQIADIERFELIIE